MLLSAPMFLEPYLPPGAFSSLSSSPNISRGMNQEVSERYIYICIYVWFRYIWLSVKTLRPWKLPCHGNMGHVSELVSGPR